MGQHLPTRTTLSITLVTSLLLAVPRPAWAAEPLRIAVDTSKLAEADRERIRKSVHEAVVEDVEAEDFKVVEDGSATALRVRIEYLDEEDLEYAIYYDIQRGAEVYSDVPWIACVVCVDAKLLRTVGEGLPKALERITELSQESEPEPAIDQPTPIEGPRVAPIGPMGVTGVVMSGVGLAVTIAGAVELSKGKVYDQGTRYALSREFQDHRPVGYGLLGAGVAVMAVGIGLLVTDTVIRAKKRKKSEASTHAFFPMFGGGVVGMGLNQRF
jgi:hypothetical protein